MDLEELRQKEVSLREAQAELAHVSRVTTMGELAASIAHEVNQPLSGIVNLSIYTFENSVDRGINSKSAWAACRADAGGNCSSR